MNVKEMGIKLWKGSLSIGDIDTNHINLVWVERAEFLMTRHEVGASSVRLWGGLRTLLFVWKLLPLRDLQPIPWLRHGCGFRAAIGCQGHQPVS